MHPILRKATVSDKKQLNSKVLEVTLKPIEVYTFRPGQFNSIKVGNAFRSYSVASLVSDNSFKNIISVGHAGLGSDFFKQSIVGDVVEFIGPTGRFYLNEPLKKHVLFLATGTGLAPFMPMFEHLALQGNIGSFVKLYFGVRTKQELFYLDKLQDLKAHNNWFDFEICLSQELTDSFIKGRITNNYTLTDPANTQAYLCGNPFMIEQNILKLRSLGLEDSDIFYEKFTTAVKSDLK